jgi:hypothetical protein
MADPLKDKVALARRWSGGSGFVQGARHLVVSR